MAGGIHCFLTVFSHSPFVNALCWSCSNSISYWGELGHQLRNNSPKDSRRTNEFRKNNASIWLAGVIYYYLIVCSLSPFINAICWSCSNSISYWEEFCRQLPNNSPKSRKSFYYRTSHFSKEESLVSDWLTEFTILYSLTPSVGRFPIPLVIERNFVINSETILLKGRKSSPTRN